ncbi:MFS transporter [Actinoplanes sp. N902-109]|uniref:MFS transporter n=1 Tax=Actinoplanes sp. (strain N902-109) TaxID=649831 RepID=UPI0003295981|nr:MFS transporter [Actinoplanes sp. N902-109]AGL17156.1 major facilitator superfamily protein [Actinoplanes sp. N902-109]
MPLLPEPGPIRTLAAATLVNTIGNGLWMTSSALYLTRSVGLPVSQAGLALTIVALVSLVTSTPVGYLADRLGPRGVAIGGLVAMGLCEAALLRVGSMTGFLLVAAPMAVFDAAQRGARGAIIGNAVPPERRVYTRAYLRAVTNVGITVGAALAGIGLTVDTRAAYLTLIAGDAATYLLAALVMTRLPAVAPVPHAGSGPRLIALRDRPFLLFVLLDGLLSTNFGLLEVAIPLWIADRTDAPHWMISAVFVVNTVTVVLLQVRAARGTDTLDGAARASRRAGFALLAACVLFSLTGSTHHVVTWILLMLGALVQVVAELWYSAGGWGVSFGLAPDHAHGQYQGAYGMGHQFGQMIAPVVTTALTIGWGTPGWLLLGAAFAVVGSLVPAVVRRAAVQRQAVSSIN